MQNETKPIILRAYQKEALKVLDDIKDGRHLCTLATGLGKTVIMANMKRTGRTLLLSHRDELVYQPAKYFDCSYGVEKANIHSNGEDVVSASVQTLYRPNRLKQFDPEHFDTIIVDEAHHCCQNNVTYMKILNYFKARRVLGFTATGRGDGIRLDDVFEDVVFARDTKWGIKNHYLCPIKAIRVVTNADITSVRKVGNDFNEKDLYRRLENSNYVSKAAAAYMQHCYKKRQTLIYTPTVKMCQTAIEVIRNLMPKDEAGSIRMVTGKTDRDERKAILDAYKNGDVQCIVNCMVLTEGFDAPETSGIIVMRPTCNTSLYQQIVGRGLRIAEDKGKENCLILDIVPEKTSPYHNICTAVSLFGENSEKAPKKTQERMLTEYDPMELADEISTAMSIIGAVKDVKSIKLMQEEFNIFAEDQAERILQKKEFDIPELLKGIHVHANPSSKERYRVRVMNHKSYVTLSEPDMLGQTDITVHGANDYKATMKLEDAVDIIKKLCVTTPEKMSFLWDEDVYERWDSVPATEPQIYRLNALMATDTEGILSNVDISALSKAQAAELIDMSIETQAAVAEMRKRKIFFDSAKTPSVQKKREQAALDAYNQYVEEMNKQDTESRNRFGELTKWLDAEYAKTVQTKAQLDKHKPEYQKTEWWKLEGKKTIHIDIVQQYALRKDRAPSEKQIAFMRKLENELALDKVSVNGRYPIKTQAEISHVITVFIFLQKNIPYYQKRQKAGLTSEIYIDKESLLNILHSDNVSKTCGDIVLYAGGKRWKPAKATF